MVGEAPALYARQLTGLGGGPQPTNEAAHGARGCSGEWGIDPAVKGTQKRGATSTNDGSRAMSASATGVTRIIFLTQEEGNGARVGRLDHLGERSILSLTSFDLREIEAWMDSQPGAAP
jgi:hypothetical protein